MILFLVNPLINKKMAKIPKDIRAELRLIYTVLLILETFQLLRIKALMAAHMVGLSKTPILPAVQILIDDANIAFPPATTAITTKNVDISIGSSDVVKFNMVAATVPARLMSIRDKVRDIMPGDKSVIKLLKLDNLSAFNVGGQDALKANLLELELKIKITPALVTIVLPLAVSLRTDIENSLLTKDEQFNVIDGDRTDIPDYVYTAKSCMLANFGALHGIFPNNLSKIIDIFPMDTIYRAQRSPDFLQKNQLAITNPLTKMLNIPKPSFSYTGYIIVENMGPEALKLFISLQLATLSPDDAITVEGNSKAIIQFKDMGSNRARYLMIEFLGSLDLVNVKLTIRKKSKAKK